MPKTRAGPPPGEALKPKGCSPWGHSQQNLRRGSATQRTRNPLGGSDVIYCVARPTTSPFLKNFKAAPGMPSRRCKAKPLRQAAAERTLETKLLGSEVGTGNGVAGASGCERVRWSYRDFGFQDTGTPKTRAGLPPEEALQPEGCSPRGKSQQNLRRGQATQRIRNPLGGLRRHIRIARPTTSPFLKKSRSRHALASLQGEAPPLGGRRAHVRDEAVRVGSRDRKWRGGCERV